MICIFPPLMVFTSVEIIFAGPPTRDQSKMRRPLSPLEQFSKHFPLPCFRHRNSVNRQIASQLTIEAKKNRTRGQAGRSFVQKPAQQVEERLLFFARQRAHLL